MTSALTDVIQQNLLTAYLTLYLFTYRVHV